MSGLSGLALAAGMASGGTSLIAMGIAGTVFGGILGNQQAKKAAALMDQSAELGSSIAAAQNKIYAEQFALQKENFMQDKRKLIRQSMQMQAGTTAVAAASGMARSSSFGAVQGNIAQQKQSGLANIQRSLESGEMMSGLNQDIATMSAQQQTLNAQAQNAANKKPFFGIL